MKKIRPYESINISLPHFRTYSVMAIHDLALVFPDYLMSQN